jgi:chromate transporter
MSTPPPLSGPASSRELFVTFTLLALQGYGGVLAVSQRVLCDRKRWLSGSEYVDVLSVAQVLPGPNICNLALIVGDRFFGWRGAAAALAGLLAVPLAIVLVLAALYAQFAPIAPVAGTLRGIASVSAGLVVGSAVKLLPTLRTNRMRLPACIVFGTAAFAGAALLHWPLAWVLVATGALAGVVAWRRVGESADSSSDVDK